MHDVERLAIAALLFVGVVQRRRHRRGDRDDVRERHVLLALAQPRQHASEVFTVDVLHREEVRLRRLADVVDLDDVVVVKRPGQARFGHEHLHERVVLRLLRAQVLDDDMAFEPFDSTGTRDR